VLVIMMSQVRRNKWSEVCVQCGETTKLETAVFCVVKTMFNSPETPFYLFLSLSNTTLLVCLPGGVETQPEIGKKEELKQKTQTRPNPHSSIPLIMCSINLFAQRQTIQNICVITFPAP
jgi:hypothetical protein